MTDQLQDAKDAAAKQRIIVHMNTDHHDSVIRYLQHYHNISSYLAYSGRITEISLSQLVISCGSTTFATPFEPAMASYREARERLVDMDKTCRQALGVSDIAVRQFVPPHGWYLALFCLVSTTLLVFSTRANLAADHPVASLLPDLFRRFCWHIQPYIFYGMIALHGVEAMIFASSRLKRHSVNVKTLVYWQWLGDAFIEGVGSFHRFDQLVTRLQTEKAARKH